MFKTVNDVAINRVLYALGDCYWEWDLKTNKIQHSNKAHCVNDVLLDNNFDTWIAQIHPNDLKATLKDIDNYLKGKTSQYTNEHRIKRKDGSYKWVLDGGAIIEFSDDGEPLVFAGIKTELPQKELLQKKLQSQEEHLNSLIMNLPGAVYRCMPDNKWTVTFIGDEIERITGYNAHDFMNSNINLNDLILSEDKRKIQKIVNSIDEKNDLFEAHYRMKHKSGRIIWIKEKGRCIFNKKGDIIFYDGIIFEITQQKFMEKQIQKMNLQLKQAVEISKVGYWEIDFLNDEVYWSDMTRKILEVPSNYKATFERCSSFFKTLKNRKRVISLINRSIETGSSWEVEAQIQTYKGNTIWVKAIGNAEFKYGKCIRVFGSFQDVNETKLNSEKIKKYDLLDQITNSVPGAIYQYIQYPDNSFKVKFISENVKNLQKEMTKEKLLKNPNLIYEIIHPEDLEGFNEKKDYALSTKTDLKHEYRVVNNDGTIFWNQIQAKPDLKEDDTVVWYGYVHNITELKELQISLKKKLRELTQKNKEVIKVSNKNVELEKFAYVVSHDLKEPLRTIKSFSKIIHSKNKDCFDKDTSMYFDLISDSANRMGGLIDGILDFSKIDVDQEITELSDANNILKVVLHDVKKYIDDTNATVKYSDLPIVRCNQFQIRQLFQNLILNGIKFASKKTNSPCIDVACQEDLDNYIFSVKDNGIGIDSSQIEKIFMMFKKLHTNDEYTGYGIGLALCKRIVEKHHGKIWVESDGQSGSTFYFSIPK